MTTKHEVIALHKQQPRWSSVQIAKQLGCCDAYVRATFRRNGLRLPRRIIRAEVVELGEACVAAGFSIADINNFNARGRRMAAMEEVQNDQRDCCTIHCRENNRTRDQHLAR